MKDGSKIEFDGSLKYYGNDSSISDSARKRLEKFESKRINNKNEYGMIVDKNGNPLTKEMRGMRGMIMLPGAAKDYPNAILTHTHPRHGIEHDMLGGTFSPSDIRDFVAMDGKTYRAKAPEGTYSISKTKNFNGDGLVDFALDVSQKFSNASHRAKIEADKQIKSGKISREEGIRQRKRAMNTALLEIHEAFKKAEKRFGYTYTLEKP